MTVEIKRFSASSGGNVIEIDIEISNGENSERKVFRLLSSQYVRMKLSKGKISFGEYEEIEYASAVCDAYLKALNILSFGANTAHTLILKLKRRGVKEQIAREAVEMLRVQGYINEDEELKREIERCLRKKWGSRRIIAHLYQKGYDDEALSASDDAFAEIDFGELCLELLEGKCDELPSDPRERQKLVSSLARYGYSMSEIKYALSKFGR